MSIDAMGNGHVHVCGCQEKTLRQAIELATEGHHVVAWEEKSGWLVFYWSDSRGLKLPAKTGPEILAGIVLSWLKANKPTGPRPGIDGSVSLGFELTTRGFPESFDAYMQFRVQAIWAEHHK